MKNPKPEAKVREAAGEEDNSREEVKDDDDDAEEAEGKEEKEQQKEKKKEENGKEKEEEEAGEEGEEEGVGEAEEEVEETGLEVKSIIMSLIKQLSYGMDLRKVTFPTHALEPRSLLERITDFLAHPEMAIQASAVEDPVQRFLGILRFFLAGWHIRPKGVKKPYNPVLGEFFRCRYQFEDGSEGFYLAEQVCHDPPISAFFFACPQHFIVINGQIAPKSRFYGNSVASLLEGNIRISLTNRAGEEFNLSLPNMYARGILVGSMFYEVSGPCRVTCEKHKLHAEIEFKSKGYFSGTRNALIGTVKGKEGLISKLSGKWSHQVFIQSVGAKTTRCTTSKPEIFFDARRTPTLDKLVPPDSDQKNFESRRLWSDVTKAIIKNDQGSATEAKTKIEEAQRKARAAREAKGEVWIPVHFTLIPGTQDWTCNYSRIDPLEAKVYSRELMDQLGFAPEAADSTRHQ